MTREEAWRRTKGYLYDVLSGEEADEIIKVLEQEPKTDVLDKIRNEMADLAARTMNDNRASGIWTCVDILDKYKRK